MHHLRSLFASSVSVHFLAAQIEEDAYQSDLGFSLGALGKSGRSSALRVPQADAKTKAKVSKSLQVHSSFEC